MKAGPLEQLYLLIGALVAALLLLGILDILWRLFLLLLTFLAALGGALISLPVGVWVTLSLLLTLSIVLSWPQRQPTPLPPPTPLVLPSYCDQCGSALTDAICSMCGTHV